MQRWFLLAAITILGFLRELGNELAAMLSTMTALLGLSLENYVYLCQLFTYLNPLFALPAAWFVDRYGVSGSCVACLLLTLVCNGARALLFLPHLAAWTDLRFVYFIIAGIGQRLLQAVYNCLPLKVAERFFAHQTERSFAWVSMLVGQGIGSTLASLAEPRYVSSVASVYLLGYMNLAIIALTCLAVGCALATMAATKCPASSSPREPLNERQQQVAQADKQPLTLGLKLLIGNKSIMLHLVTISVFNNMDWLTRGLMQDILASSGLSRVFCGNLLAGTSGLSCLIMLASSFLDNDRTGRKRNTLRCKLFVLTQWLGFNLYALSLIVRLPGESAQLQSWLLVACMAGYTACRAWFSPALNNLLAHLVAGSTSPAALNAASTIIDFFFSNFFTITFVKLRRVSEQGKQTNYLNPIAFLLAMVAACSLAYLTCFSGRKEPVVVVTGGQQQADSSAERGIVETTTEQNTAQVVD